MKRYLLVALALVLTPAFASSPISYLVVLADNAVMADATEKLELQNIQIRLRVPPSILTAVSDKPIDFASLVPVKAVHTEPVSVGLYESYGPVATAAVVQWNRELVREATATLGVRGASSIRTKAAQNSLPAPSNLTAAVEGAKIRLAWQPVTGAVRYEAQVSNSAAFPSSSLTSTVMESPLDMPLLQRSQPNPIYARVRALDSDLSGAWSNPISVSAPAFSNKEETPAPTLTSPQDGTSTDGLTLILEWIANPSALYRLQMATKDSFKNILLDQIVVGGEFVVPPAFLTVGNTYHWQVQLWDANGSDWSSSRKVTIGEPIHLDTDAMVNPEAPQ